MNLEGAFSFGKIFSTSIGKCIENHKIGSLFLLYSVIADYSWKKNDANSMTKAFINKVKYKAADRRKRKNN